MRLSEISSPWDAEIRYFDRCVSTMDEARGQLENSRNAREGELFLTEFQTGGRGRRGRSWFSEPGANILMTLALLSAPLKKSGKAALLPLLAGAALASACMEILPGKKGGIRVKWPNDLMINNRKAAGVLCEAVGEHALVGCGINVNQQTFGESLAATSLRFENGGAAVSRERVLSVFLERIHSYLLDENDICAVINGMLWRRGERIRFRSGAPESSEIIEGVLVGAGGYGGALIRDIRDGSEKEYVSGEILF